MPLLDHRGNPITSAVNKQKLAITNKKATPPKLGEAFGDWAGRDTKELLRLPGGGLLQFNLDNLELADYRQMKDHYQVNSSLSVLTFMMHQLDWHMECDDKKIEDHCGENLTTIWGRLVRSKSQAFWSGYSPNVLQWENDLNGNTLQLTKVKDLLPEECWVKWKLVEGWSPPGRLGKGPTQRVYDGFHQLGRPYPVPVDNSYWYPLLMENGDYYGKKLLRSAFTPFFFSMLLHLFANRYFERFGEPLPIGRAPYDETVTVNDEEMSGNVLMENVISQIRNRSVVVLPNDKTLGSETTPDWDYQLEYLESQMRGADFERYMTRLDEEISLALFTPLLLMRTGDVGSYSLGEQHTKTWLWVLNALAADWAEYMNRYILSPMVNFNFSPNAPRCRIVFRKMGKTDAETVRALITALVSGDKAKPDLEDLGQIAGLTLKEVRTVTGSDPEEDPSTDPPANPPAGPEKANLNSPRYPQAHAVARDISARVAGQVAKAFREGTFGDGFQASLGYKRRFAEALKAHGATDATAMGDRFYSLAEGWVEAVSSLGTEEFPNADSFMQMFDTMLATEIGRL
jgi:hypothetical protein